MKVGQIFSIDHKIMRYKIQGMHNESYRMVARKEEERRERERQERVVRGVEGMEVEGEGEKEVGEREGEQETQGAGKGTLELRHEVINFSQTKF